MNAFPLPTLGCRCAGFRRAARALTQLYDSVLRPLGLRGSRFTILQALSRVSEISQGQWGQILAMDSTTLRRTLRIMHQNRWILERRGKDRRERLLRLSSTGKKLLSRATPEWEKVQLRLRKQIGDKEWQDLARAAEQVADVALPLS